MRALLVEDKEKIVLRDLEKARIEKDEVLIKVAYCGICGSDLPRYFQGAVHQFPQILGHEFSGEIVELGEEVSGLEIGQKVTAAPLVPCHQCADCLSGNFALCENYSFIGSRQAGAMAEYLAVPAENVVVLKEGLSLELAAMIEPLTVAIHGLDQIHTRAYEDYLILGSGTIGLMALLAAQHRGGGSITVVDINDQKLEAAKSLGADRVINSSKVDLNQFYKDNPRPTVIIETAGSHITQIQAIELSAKKTKIVYLGTCTTDLEIPAASFEKILRNELEIKGSWMSYSNPFPGYEWKAAQKIIEEKQELVASLITHQYPLEKAEEAFNKMIDREDHVVKVMFRLEHQ